MGYSKRLGVTGPLVAYRDGFFEDLAGKGYTTASAMRQVCLLADLSRWLERRALGAGDLRPARVEEFLSARRAEGYTALLSGQGLAPLLGYLRGLGAAPVAAEPAASTPAEILVQEYRAYLAHERRLAASSIERYLGPARLFVSERERRDGLDLEHLTASDVTAFVVSQCRTRRRGSAKVLVTALRSLLRFLFLQGCTACPLAQAVPTATGWADQSLPRALGAGAVTALLHSCDRHTSPGCGTSPSSRCWHASGCEPVRWPPSRWRISTGTTARWWCAARGDAGSGCPCPPTSARPSSPICAIVRDSPAGPCS